MSVQTILQRAERELHAGRIWRAKEILRGAVGSAQSDPLLLERYGQLLDALGDRYEAARYLFASGARGPVPLTVGDILALSGLCLLSPVS